jgi:hypothetical protein
MRDFAAAVLCIAAVLFVFSSCAKACEQGKGLQICYEEEK